MNRSVEQRMIVGFGLSVILVVIIGIVAYQNAQAFVAAFNQVTQTLEVLRELEDTFSDLVDSEAGQRGFIITADESYLAQYNTSGATLDDDIQRVQALIADRPQQQERLKRLEPLIAERVRLFQIAIDLRVNEGFGAARQFTLTGEEKALTDEIRALFNEMKSEENARLIRQRADHFALANNAFTTLGSLIVFTAALLIITYQVIRRNISDLKQTQTALSQLESKWRSLLENTPDFISTFDLDYRLTYVNRTSPGIRPDDLIGKSIYDLVPPEQRTDLKKAVEQVIETHKATSFEVTSAISNRHALNHLAPILVDGEISSFITSSTDITIRKQIEAENAYQAFLLANVNDAILATDSKRVATYWNKAAEEIYGYHAEEIVGKPISDVLRSEITDEQRTEILRQLAETGRYRVEVCQYHKNGKALWIEGTNMSLRNDHGDVTGYVSVNRDMTERKQVEARVALLNEDLQHRAASLEVANKELESFSYSVSHDLRAPLRTIAGFSQAIAEDYASQLDAEGKNYLQRIQAAAQRMGELIDDLLKLARITRMEMHFETVNMSELAHMITAELQQTQPERQAEFVIAEGLIANGDSQLLRIVLENLLGNAWKFTARRPQARIEVGLIEHSEHEQVFVIRDDGEGFDMAYADKLFGAFQRLHAMTEFEGTGIGLATVQRIVHRHGGRVWAEGAVSKGAAFYFTLPIKNNIYPPGGANAT